MAKRKVLHALYRYVNDEGREQFALNGEVVDIDGAELTRGERLGALGAIDQPPAVAAKAEEPLGDFPEDEAGQDAWIGSAKVDEVTSYADAHPDSKAALIAAEERRGEKARKTLLLALAS